MTQNVAEQTKTKHNPQKFQQIDSHSFHTYEAANMANVTLLHDLSISIGKDKKDIAFRTRIRRREYQGHESFDLVTYHSLEYMHDLEESKKVPKKAKNK